MLFLCIKFLWQMNGTAAREGEGRLCVKSSRALIIMLIAWPNVGKLSAAGETSRLFSEQMCCNK